MDAMSESWKQQYAHAVAGAAADGDAKATSSARSSSVQQFLESALKPTSPAAKQQPAAAVGEELLVPLSELSTTALQKTQGLDRDALMRVLQLQVICRLLCCCSATKKKKKKAVASSSSATELKVLKKEMRSLLDRIALLLDAANPPSLTDEDERSPFHEFLQDVLAKAFAKRLPKLVKFLLSVYEIEDETTREMANLTLTTQAAKQPSAAPSAAAPVPPAAAAAPSMLSALLRDEQRPLKRSRTETEVPFKKMELPNELRRRSSFPSTRRDLLKAASKTGKALSVSASAPTSSPALPRRSTTSSSKKKLPSAEKPSLTPQSSLGARSTSGSKATPLLMRNIDRALFAGPQSRFTPSASNNTPHTSTGTSSTGSLGIRPPFGSPLATTPKGFKPVMPGAAPTTATAGAAKAAAPPRTAVVNLIKTERASVVMRTPDRPQRRPHRATRVLIESSPPFRNPNVGAGAAAARQRKQPTAIPPPLLR